MKLKALVLLVFAQGLLASCDNDSSTPAASFDRAPLLQNLGEELIIPAYVGLDVAAHELGTSAQAFTAGPTTETLDDLRAQWLVAYHAFQKVAFFAFGPADNLLLNNALNHFPTSKIKIEQFVSDGEYDLNAVASNDAKGFAALDYLLYGDAETDAELLARYQDGPDAANRKAYLLDLVADITSRTEAVLNEWQPDGGNYLSTFISRTGNDVGSSTGLFLNSFIQYLERDLRDGKLGIPLGVRSLGVPIPNNCEALYAGASVPLAETAVSYLKDIYLGRGTTDGTGFDDYLDAIGARYNGGQLDDAIQTQLTAVVAKVSAVPQPLSETVVSTPDPGLQAYQELQKLVILLKVDMMSALGILITYQDNDGD